MGGKLKPPCPNPLFSSLLLRGREVSHQIRVMFYVAHFGASTSSSEQWETSWRILSIGWASVWHKIRTIWVPDVLIRVNSVSFNLGFHFLLSLPVSHSWELARELLGKIADWKKREGDIWTVLPNTQWCLVFLLSARLLQWELPPWGRTTHLPSSWDSNDKPKFTRANQGVYFSYL